MRNELLSVLSPRQSLSQKSQAERKNEHGQNKILNFSSSLRENLLISGSSPHLSLQENIFFRLLISLFSFSKTSRRLLKMILTPQARDLPLHVQAFSYWENPLRQDPEILLMKRLYQISLLHHPSSLCGRIRIGAVLLKNAVDFIIFSPVPAGIVYFEVKIQKK